MEVEELPNVHECEWHLVESWTEEQLGEPQGSLHCCLLPLDTNSQESFSG